jgi:hypothetical protein
VAIEAELTQQIPPEEEKVLRCWLVAIAAHE